MIGLKVNNEWVDIAPGQKVRFEIVNPIFATDTIPGTVTMPFNIDLRSRNNRKVLGWPDRLSVTNKTDTIQDVELYILGAFYKRGVLKYRGQSNQIASYNFQTEAGDFNNLIQGRKIRNLDFGTANYQTNVINGKYPEYDYALFPVKNTKFYGDKNTSYLGYVNYYDTLFRENTVNSPKHTRVPFPYLVNILKKTFALFGYTITGDWFEEEDTERIVIINNYALDKMQSGTIGFKTSFALANHLPDITVSELILSVKKQFGLTFIYNSKEKTAVLHKLDDVIGDVTAFPARYLDWSEKAYRDYNDKPVDYKGYKLSMQMDSTDDALEALGNQWLELLIDNGVSEINCSGAPLNMLTEYDIIGARTWTVPAITQSGSSEEFDLGVNVHPLRLMYYQGLDGYPKAHYIGTANDLRWEGANGLYETKYKRWLAFLKTAIGVKRNVNLSFEDVQNLDPTIPVMIDHLKYFWVKIAFSVGSKKVEVSDVNMIKI